MSTVFLNYPRYIRVISQWLFTYDYAYFVLHNICVTMVQHLELAQRWDLTTRLESVEYSSLMTVGHSSLMTVGHSILKSEGQLRGISKKCVPNSKHTTQANS